MAASAVDGTISTDNVYRILREVVDPEVGINVVDMGLIYDVAVQEDRVAVTMTLTSPACPMGAHLADESRQTIIDALGSSVQVEVNLVWEPAWSPEMMSDEAKQLLGWQ